MNQSTPTIDGGLFTQQDHAAYTAADHDVWALLFDRRMKQLEENGSRLFLDGADRIGLRPDRVPDLSEVNVLLKSLTGWRAVPVIGFIPAPTFFACLADRRFPTTVTVRSKEQLDYLPEPDIFHDVFGHVPLHADPVFADFLAAFGRVASAAETEAEITAMARLFWFTVEFGLINERDGMRVYGSGLISSHEDARNALGPTCTRRTFELDAVLAQPFEIDRIQDTLFVIDSFEQLFDAVQRVSGRMKKTG